jgi:hypothetical protein
VSIDTRIQALPAAVSFMDVADTLGASKFVTAKPLLIGCNTNHSLGSEIVSKTSRMADHEALTAAAKQSGEVGFYSLLPSYCLHFVVVRCPISRRASSLAQRR